MVGTMPLAAASAVCSATLGASRLRMLLRRWKMASPIHMGIMRSRYEGSFSPTPSRRFVRLCFY